MESRAWALGAPYSDGFNLFRFRSFKTRNPQRPAN